MATGAAGSGATRRDELLGIAGQLFADRGLRSTTVRDIADTAGILSGSLYHHFDSKESMVDELLRGFLDGLFARYREIAAAGLSATETLRQLVIASFEAIDSRHTAVAIYQNEARHLASQDRFGYINERNTEFQDLWESVLRRGVAEGDFRSDLDVDLVYRFLRDTVWVAVRWYRPGGSKSVDEIADQYLGVVLDGILPR
ncbi:MAG TPA: TetR/AcrR family transcriptional regulator [Gordonia sp. (in: high G+C Gram-positive bacteria)]|uniref:TetR/AcrR family transcriptional regulator n=1 Tax=unclassified Gordonia (in: high G+C Gram-positive bacteria) TaxID=2657482 RepID=UPI000F9D9537|nr:MULTISPECIES: TetR/AcrR family transcriptional regulator [unclassified Gordonia (in: high G+C Gram-positive bacteria)]RUP41245.1 MAG: TetR/AcrR family transcriptional regulator [Gordonia sp. (in: high G+C Gram-positive bacteria)]HNP55551.1 TetR/AcrR family transcriptional regulator [Gordonia sp. (in: high G+C Gram-positive bacteria)]HRC51021.1 TetR/AcrR family transcriptional regulator [Gordonia sp. (in: high G+C Gram-positive bacteria)]